MTMTMSDTPITQDAYAEVCFFTNEAEATDAVATMRDVAQKLERDNVHLRQRIAELTSTIEDVCCGARL